MHESERKRRHVTQLAAHPRHLSGCSKNPPFSFKLHTFCTQDINWIDDENGGPDNYQLALGGPYPHMTYQASLGCAPLILVEKHRILLPVCCAGCSLAPLCSTQRQGSGQSLSPTLSSPQRLVRCSGNLFYGSMRRIMCSYLIGTHKADDLVPPTLIMSTCIETLPPQELLALTRHPAASRVLDTIIDGTAIPP